MTPFSHAGRGALWSVSLVALVLSFSCGSEGPLWLPYLWIFVCVYAGPWAFFLALPLAWILDRGPESKRVTVGVVLGVPLGVILAALALMTERGAAVLTFAELRPYLPAAIVGGAGLGFGTALKDAPP